MICKDDIKENMCHNATFFTKGSHQPTYAIQYEDNLKYAAWLAGES